MAKKPDFTNANKKHEEEDYYINEDGNWVFTEAYLLKRGKCCNRSCKHCPYDQERK